MRPSVGSRAFARRRISSLSFSSLYLALKEGARRAPRRRVRARNWGGERVRGRARVKKECPGERARVGSGSPAHASFVACAPSTQPLITRYTLRRRLARVGEATSGRSCGCDALLKARHRVFCSGQRVPAKLGQTWPDAGAFRSFSATQHPISPRSSYQQQVQVDLQRPGGGREGLRRGAQGRRRRRLGDRRRRARRRRRRLRGLLVATLLARPVGRRDQAAAGQGGGRS